MKKLLVLSSKLWWKEIKDNWTLHLPNTSVLVWPCFIWDNRTSVKLPFKQLEWSNTQLKNSSKSWSSPLHILEVVMFFKYKRWFTNVFQTKRTVRLQFWDWLWSPQVNKSVMKWLQDCSITSCILERPTRKELFHLLLPCWVFQIQRLTQWMSYLNLHMTLILISLWEPSFVWVWLVQEPTTQD